MSTFYGRDRLRTIWEGPRPIRLSACGVLIALILPPSFSRYKSAPRISLRDHFALTEARVDLPIKSDMADEVLFIT